MKSEVTVISVSEYTRNLFFSLSCIFHINLLRRLGSQTTVVLDSHFDWSSVYTYSPASQFFSLLVLIGFAERLRTLQYEIFELTEFFTFLKVLFRQLPLRIALIWVLE
ncbi:MAG: hypothetical protein K9M81_01245 [Chthoniobacterales bacterium]|nr:hypothetical protein [Chthoniobacterales bacterium]